LLSPCPADYETAFSEACLNEVEVLSGCPARTLDTSLAETATPSK
jgi:hypothetical protein